MKSTPPATQPPLYVLQVGWRCTGKDGTYYASSYGTCSFNQPVEVDGIITPYDELTEEQVLEWCWDSGVSKEATELSINSQIENQKNPPVVMEPLPWSANV
jgi:hypothetical protein